MKLLRQPADRPPGTTAFAGLDPRRAEGTTMRVFRDLFIRGEPEGIAAAVDEINRSLTGGWFRDWEDERRLAAVPGLGGKPTCFGCFAEGDRPGATVILTPKGPDTLYASNVIPHS